MEAIARSPADGYTEPGGDGLILVRVRDTGSGIAPADLPNIFIRSFRGDRDRRSNVRGAGLGLAIVKRILDLHRSTITVDSTPGRGTTFTFPLARWSG